MTCLHFFQTRVSYKQRLFSFSPNSKVMTQRDQSIAMSILEQHYYHNAWLTPTQGYGQIRSIRDGERCKTDKTGFYAALTCWMSLCFQITDGYRNSNFKMIRFVFMFVGGSKSWQKYPKSYFLLSAFSLLLELINWISTLTFTKVLVITSICMSALVMNVLTFAISGQISQA